MPALSHPPAPSERRQTYGGLWVPIITPFIDDEIDIAATQRLVASIAGAHCRGIVVCGTTGEAATLREAEQRRLLDAVAEAAPASLRIAMGIAGSDTQAVASAARRFSDSPAQVLLVSAPPYSRPSQAGIVAHYRQILNASGLPLIVYNVPYRTGVNIDIESMLRLAEHPRVVAVKESAGETIDQLFDLIQRTDLAILSGEDKLLLTAACLGADGAISAAANVRPDLYQRLLDDVRAARIGEARQRFASLMPLIRLLFAEPNPAVIKAALAQQGLIVDGLRLPMLPASPQIREALAPVLDNVLRLT